MSLYMNMENMLKVINNNQKMSTCNRLDLETLGSQPIMPINLPKHWYMATLMVYKNGHQFHVQ